MGLSTSFSFCNKFPHIAFCLAAHSCSNAYEWNGTFSVDVIINGKKFECFKVSSSHGLCHTHLVHMLTVDEALLENERSHANNEFPFLIRGGTFLMRPVPLSKEECTSIKGRVLMGEYDHNLDEAVFKNEWNHVEIKVTIKRPTFMQIGIHVLKEKNSMEDIRLPDNKDDFETIDQLANIIFVVPALADFFIKRKEVEEKLRSMLSSNFECLDLSGCHLSNQCFPIGLIGFPNLKELNLSKNDFTYVPECFKEWHFLEKLQLDYCENLENIYGIPPSLRYLSIKGCNSLWLWDTDMLMLLKQELHEAGNTYFCLPRMWILEWIEHREKELYKGGNSDVWLPGSGIPEWFEHQRMGLSTSFWFRNKFPNISLCLALYCPQTLWCFHVIVIINGKEFKYMEEFGFNKLDNTYLFNVQKEKFKFDKALLEHEWNHVEIKIHSDSPIKVESGIHIFKEKSSMEDICFTDPHRKLDFNLPPLPENDEKLDLSLAPLLEK